MTDANNKVEQAVLQLQLLSSNERESANTHEQVQAKLQKILHDIQESVEPGKYLLVNNDGQDAGGEDAVRVEQPEDDEKSDLDDLIRTSREHIAIVNSKMIPLTQYLGKEFTAHIDRRPRSLILNDPRITANTIIEGRYQFVIVNYHFVMARYRDHRKYEPFFSLVKLLGMDKAIKTCSTPTYKHLIPHNTKKRSANAIFSNVFEEMGLIWHHLVLDEATFVKNTRSETHNAVRGIRAAKVWMASGTFLDNRWWDVYGLCAQLPGVHPFQDRRLFDRAFAQKIDGRYQDPSVTKRYRLIKWLQAFTICRPDTVLTLPNMRVVWWNFELNHTDEITVAAHTLKCIYALKMKAMESTDVVSALVEENGSAALMHAMRAQQICANPSLISQDEHKRQKALLKSAQNTIQNLLADWAMAAALDPDLMPLDDKDEDESRWKGSDERKIDVRMKIILEKALSSKAGHMNDQERTDEGKSEAESIQDIPMTDADSSEPELHAGHEDGDNEQGGETDLINIDTEVMDDSIRKAWVKRVSLMTQPEIFSTKINEVLFCIRHIVGLGSQDIVVFSTFLTFLDIIGEAITRSRWANDAGLEVIRFDGTVSDKERILKKTQFEAKTENTKIMLATPGAGGYGLELSTAQHVLQVEPWWNHNKEEQAWSRAHRQGNRNAVTVWRFIASNSLIDSVFLAIAGKKTVVNESIMKYLRVSPGEKPRIPKQFSGSTGEY
ncbi:hypothetical protein HRS9139_01666 [Pyrenophora teres f. teres]|nr:hypothetical protein HRS9139_01666 [Pyrenophora teres f. teres]